MITPTTLVTDQPLMTWTYFVLEFSGNDKQFQSVRLVNHSAGFRAMIDIAVAYNCLLTDKLVGNLLPLLNNIVVSVAKQHMDKDVNQVDYYSSLHFVTDRLMTCFELSVRSVIVNGTATIYNADNMPCLLKGECKHHGNDGNTGFGSIPFSKN